MICLVFFCQFITMEEPVIPVPLMPSVYIDDMLFLHPSDSSRVSLVLFKLTEAKNYQLWSRRALATILDEIKIGYIDGTCSHESIPP